MQSKREGRMMRLGLAAVVCTMVMSGCALEDQTAPPLGGPSGFGLSVRLTATPDFLPRDGSSMSKILMTVRDEKGDPVTKTFNLSPSAGSLSVDQVTTDKNGEASLWFTSPSFNTNVGLATVYAIPVGTDFGNATQWSVAIALNGPSVPSPSFTVAPAAPAQFELATFDGSPSTVGGAACGGACTYAWDFGDGSTGTGRVVQHRFQVSGAVVVTLTVTSPSGTFASASQTVSVGNPLAPTATLTFSPTNPHSGIPVNFNASGSTAANGATIVQYLWNFGGGAATSVVTTTPLNTATFTLLTADDQTYIVTVTVVDSNGQRATATASVSVSP